MFNSKKILESRYTILILQVVLGGLFILSAYSKIIMPGIVEIILIDHGIFKDRTSAGYFVRVLIGGELALGLMLFQKNYLKRIIIPVSVLLLAVFTVYLFYTGLILGDKDNCGCFGDMVIMSPVESILKNIFLLIVSIILFILIKKDGKKIILPFVLILISFSFVFITVPVKNIKDFKFSQYTYFERAGRVDLSTGNKIVAVFNLECDHCQEVSKELAGLIKKNSHIPEVYVLFFKEGNTTPLMFQKMTNSNFPYHIISSHEFFDLIGSSPPRLYWLKDGVIMKIWDEEFEKSVTANFGN
jgi:hypothetical protein